MDEFHPCIASWFHKKLGTPTQPQREGWPKIRAGKNVLIAAPTGTGKTLAAFLVCIDRLLKQAVVGPLPSHTQIIYVSPLKALSYDIQKNLTDPVEEIWRAAEGEHPEIERPRILVRTGDTPAAERQRMLKQPPHILVTTPESLYLMLTSTKSRDLLTAVDTVIVDEIHAMARDKRGSHLMLTLERLAALTDLEPTRIGLSATQRPLQKMANFLVGAKVERPPALIVDVGHTRELDLGIVTPQIELSAVCSHEQWQQVYQGLTEMIQAHRSCLIFVNTRRLAERVTHYLTEILGEDAVASHHGSLAKHIRLAAEERLRQGKLRAIVATASLELGIDIGYIDIVCQIGSPRSIATFLQRVGRSGHSISKVPKGRLFALTRDELLECCALVYSAKQGRLDTIDIPRGSIDILMQQIVAEVSAQEWRLEDLFQQYQQAMPYANLTLVQFRDVIKLLNHGLSAKTKHGSYLHHDELNERLKARRSARLAALTSGGAIPELAEYRVVTSDGQYVGALDEDFAIESSAGDIFLLGNTSWQIEHVRSGKVTVHDAGGAPPTIPFWRGEAPGRTFELSREVSVIREKIDELFGGVDECIKPHVQQSVCDWLVANCGTTASQAQQVVDYHAAQLSATGHIPTRHKVIFERFFDESGSMQLVVHAPFGSRITRAWGLALRKRYCRKFDFELQASADDNGFVLSIGAHDSFSLSSLFNMVHVGNGVDLLTQAILQTPMFQVRWRWNVTRALAVLRFQGQKKIPPHLQRFRSDDLLAAVFPEQTQCFEHRSGDLQLPEHPLVQQTMHDCMTEAMDVDRWIAILQQIKDGKIEIVASELVEPSAFSHQLLNANPYAFLDDAPLEERRTRAVSTRRTLDGNDLRNLGTLDPAAIAQVRLQAWPIVRDIDELHDALVQVGFLLLNEIKPWLRLLEELEKCGRCYRWQRFDGQVIVFAVEQLSVVRAAYHDQNIGPSEIPKRLLIEITCEKARLDLVQKRMEITGPCAAAELAHMLGWPSAECEALLTQLEAAGRVLSGRFSAASEDRREWCDRQLLMRIHRQTLAGLREQIRPVSVADYLRFLCDHQHLSRSQRLEGPAGTRAAIQQLAAFEAPAGVWEQEFLSTRIVGYDGAWLDELTLSGQILWSRVRDRRHPRPARHARGFHRAVPIVLVPRSERTLLAGSLAAQQESVPLSHVSERLLKLLDAHGAQFADELLQASNLLPSQLLDGIKELVSLGMITADGFAIVRQFCTRRSLQGPNDLLIMSKSGRWSRAQALKNSIDESIERWADILLMRYGVVFYGLLARERHAPLWRQLVEIYRQREMRGLVRGGRFIDQVSGEQFALPSTIERLRAVRSSKPTGEYVIFSAADPVNLVGVLTKDKRISAVRTNRLILQDGRLVGALQAGKTIFYAKIDPSIQNVLQRGLRLIGSVRVYDPFVQEILQQSE